MKLFVVNRCHFQLHTNLVLPLCEHRTIPSCREACTAELRGFHLCQCGRVHIHPFPSYISTSFLRRKKTHSLMALLKLAVPLYRDTYGSFDSPGSGAPFPFLVPYFTLLGAEKPDIALTNIKEACRLDSNKITLNYARQYGLIKWPRPLSQASLMCCLVRSSEWVT